MVKAFRILRTLLIVFLVVFIGAQFIRPDRTNPPTPPGTSLIGKATPQVAKILDRSCRDCHSNDTRWPWYTNLVPVSWLVASDVHEGRDHFNFSMWTTYDSDEQDKLLNGMCALPKRHRMPLPKYLLIHKDATLSDADIATLCAWTESMRDMLQ
jgi:hypothetical protein